MGTGAVGLACAYSILNQSIASEIVLIDIPQVQEKLRGEIADLQHGAAFGRVRESADEFPGPLLHASVTCAILF